MNFKSYSDLSNDIRSNLFRLRDENYDLVVGIPRSGMIPAYMIALALNINCTSLQSFLENQKLSHGSTRETVRESAYPWDATKVLLVDDSILSGNSLRSSLDLFPPELLKKITTLVVYSSTSKRNDVDIIFSYVPKPRIFEWNVFHHKYLSNACVDIENILGVELTEEQNEDEENYTRFLSNANPVRLPGYKIHSLITRRLERYRPQTEKWLHRHNIKYENLIMAQDSAMGEEASQERDNSFKPEYYRRNKDLILFFESDPIQANNICKSSGKPVFCLKENKMFYPNLLYSIANNSHFFGGLIDGFKDKIKRYFKN